MMMKYRTTKTNYVEVYATANALYGMCAFIFFSLDSVCVSVPSHSCTLAPAKEECWCESSCLSPKTVCVFLLLFLLCYLPFFHRCGMRNSCDHLFFTSKWAQNKYWSVFCVYYVHTSMWNVLNAYLLELHFNSQFISTAESKHDQETEQLQQH